MVAHPAELDPLTGLSSYSAVVDVMEEKATGDGVFSLVVYDIDLFKRLNDQHGRAVGDQILMAIAGFLREEMGGQEIVARYGGDAFAVVLDLEKEAAFLHAERIRSRIEGRPIVCPDDRGLELVLTASAGVAAYPDDASAIPLLMRKANEAVYRAKVNGRNRTCLAREEKMVTKTSHYTQGQLEGLARLAKREKLNEAVLLREGLDDLLRKYNA